MLKIKHEDIARILGISRGYSQLLLHRNKLKLKQEFLDQVIRLIAKRLKDA
jgi:DNA-directed RNA polymerase specialized sigma24 family protein